jgi:LPXTG-motif cell wall-anchored protein
MRRLALAALVVTASLGGLPLASAQAPVCDSYSSACPSATSTSVPPEVEPTRLNRPNPSTLPLTGGQLVGLLLLGGGTIAAGTAFVVTGRRKGAHSG